MSDTPRTDALSLEEEWVENTWQNKYETMSKLARQLERENVALRAELEAQSVVNGKGSEREAKLIAENIARRVAHEKQVAFLIAEVAALRKEAQP